MKRSTKLWLLIIAAVSCMTVTALAQVPATSEAPIPTPALTPEPVIPTPTNPLPDLVDLEKSVIYLLSSAPWYLLAAVVLFVLVALIRGKLKLGGWTVKIPWFSDWLNNKEPKVKFWLIIGFTGLGSGFSNLATVVTPWKAVPVAMALLFGVAAGVTIALAAMGAKAGWKAHRKAKKDPVPAPVPTDPVK